MSPEANITTAQTEQVRSWIDGNKTVKDHSIKREGLWDISTVRGEPIIILLSFPVPGICGNKLYCSDRQAKELEEAGIVKFPEPTQGGVASSNNLTNSADPWLGHA
jgi:hypothetical protein